MKILKYLRNYRMFKESGYNSIQELINEANIEPLPITLTKIKKGEVIEKVSMNIQEGFNSSVNCILEIGEHE